MDVLVANLHEDRAALGQQVARHGQPVAQISQVGVDAVAPGVSKSLHLLGLAGDVRGLAVLHVTAGGGPLEVGVEADAVGRVDIDALHLAAQALALRQRCHHLQAVAEDHAVRPVGVMAVELGRRRAVGQPVEIGEEVGRGRRLLLPPFLRLAQQVVDQDFWVHLLLDVERRRLDDEIGGVLLVLAAPDELRVEVAVAPLVGHADRRLVFFRHDGVVFRRRDIAPRRLSMRERLDGFGLLICSPCHLVPFHAACCATCAAMSWSNPASISCTSVNSANAHRPNVPSAFTPGTQ